MMTLESLSLGRLLMMQFPLRFPTTGRQYDYRLVEATCLISTCILQR